MCFCEPVALLYPSREHGQRGGAAERTTLEDLQPVRNTRDGQGPRSGGPGESFTLAPVNYEGASHSSVSVS